MDVDIVPLAVGSTVTLDIGKVAHGGHFVAHHEGRVIFVRHAITGEKVSVKITSISKKLAFGDAIKIINPSKDRVIAPCTYAKPEGCGGCDFLHINVKTQKELKSDIIKEQFLRLAKIEINPEIISEDSLEGLNWRTRLNLAISKNKKLGLHAHKSN